MKVSHLIGVVTFALTNATPSIAQAPDNFTFQGVLLDDSDNPVTGDVDIVSKLYAGTTLLHEETHNNVSVDNGVFSIVITDTDSISFDQQIEVGISVDGDPEMVPRTPILMAPYAQSLVNFRIYPIYANPAAGPTIVGGHRNNFASTGLNGVVVVGGGVETAPNQGLGNYAVVVGGYGNVAGESSGILGGIGNSATGTGWVVGGNDNTASGTGSFVGAGLDNEASGIRSTIPGGKGNKATKTNTFAAGELAGAVHNGAFVWQDASTVSDTLLSTGTNQFLARASGGFHFLTAGAPNLLTGATLASGSGAWASLSSKAAKSDFVEVDPMEYLEKVAGMGIQRWRYMTEGGGVTHVGPFAEDFYEAFGLGPSEQSITTVDADGVALVAIQGLYRLVQEQAATIRELQSRLDRLE